MKTYAVRFDLAGVLADRGMKSPPDFQEAGDLVEHCIKLIRQQMLERVYGGDDIGRS